MCPFYQCVSRGYAETVVHHTDCVLYSLQRRVGSHDDRLFSLMSAKSQHTAANSCNMATFDTSVNFITLRFSDLVLCICTFQDGSLFTCIC